ncbi:neurogenic locus protein delta [Planococcus citri]|uniref:neurogenic locus protein delta n=1 Tax=Planococcus citri TaxID=170843 RepID=UPI0031F7F962
MVWRQALVFYAFFISIVKIQQVVCSGVFELRLKSFINENGKDSLGQCCSGVQKGATCVGTCSTRFRVCLKHFQQKIDTSTCTFGNVITPVLGSNNVHLTDGALDIPGFANPIRFPFDFSWPGTFSLIVEAWHDATSGNTSADDAGVLSNASSGFDIGPGRVLISRISDTKYLEVNSMWTPVKFESSNSSISFEFRVMCDVHYYGAGCANLCRPRDDGFGHYSCSPSGERICYSGWKGEYCTKPRCAVGCDETHGYCNKPGECLCHVGWKGRLCSECEKYPGCIRGTCSKPWECLCDEGWGGLFCNQDLNYCTNHKPCRNGGTCFNTGQGSYTCSCPPGYTGTDCDIRLSDCSHKPCLNGAACKQNGTSYQCECSKGWYGTHCEIAVQTCEVKPCKHGGTCRDTIHGYKCSCPAGFNGAECQNVVNHCTPNPCSNGGNCTALPHNQGHKCSCPSGFTGKNCETNIDDCKGNPCRNGGTCVDLVNNYKCHCVPGYAGLHCDQEVDYCKAKPCANGGVCETLLNDYQCRCKPGFSGKDCSVEVDECAPPNPCQNGATCQRLSSGAFECNCANGYSGQRCENDDSSASPNAIIANDRHIAIASVAAAAAGGGSDEAYAEKVDGNRWFMIVVVSVSVPILVIIAVLIVTRMKQRRERDQKKADDEARMQNEQNSVHSSVTMTKRGETHMIKNTWGQCVKNVDVDTGAGDLCYPKQVQYTALPAADPNLAPAYTLQRSRSQKQLNVDPPLHRHSVCNRVSCKDLDNIVRSSTPASLDNRLSVLSINISHSNLSDSSLNKQHSSQLLEKDKSVHNNTLNSSVLNSSIGGGSSSNGGVGGGNGSSVYVIDEHFTQTLFATEV